MWVGEGVVGRVGLVVGGRCVDRAGEPYTPTINICCCAVLGIHVAKPADHPYLTQSQPPSLLYQLTCSYLLNNNYIVMHGKL